VVQLVTVIYDRLAGLKYWLDKFWIFFENFILFSDRYKVFIDLFNLASFLVPREFLPKLTTEMKMRLAVASVESSENDNKQAQEPHRISGKSNAKEDGLMSKDDFHPVDD